MPKPNPPNPADSIRPPLLWLRRRLFLGLVAGTALIGLIAMDARHRTSRGSSTPWRFVVLVLFTVTFSWISLSFWNAVIGFALMVLGRDPLSLGRVMTRNPDGPITSPTALVMPARNEDPERVMSSLAAMLRSLARTGHGDQFDLHLLSDTTDRDARPG